MTIIKLLSGTLHDALDAEVAAWFDAVRAEVDARLQPPGDLRILGAGTVCVPGDVFERLCSTTAAEPLPVPTQARPRRVAQWKEERKQRGRG